MRVPVIARRDERLSRSTVPDRDPIAFYSTMSFLRLCQCDHLALFGLRHLELRQRRARMTEKHVPIALADAHASMAERHIPSAVVHRPARAGAQEVDQKLLLTIRESSSRHSSVSSSRAQ
jgi:hypothetical protein